MQKTEKGVKRYNLVLPEDLFEEVQKIADREQTSVIEILRRFIKLGLIASKLGDKPGAELIIRDGNRERQLLLI